MLDFHGVCMTHYFTDNWENLQNFEAKPDDILIASFPKSGNTWMSYIIDLLCCGIPPEDQQNLTLPLKVPTLEVVLPLKSGKEVVYESDQKVVCVIGSGTAYTGVDHANALSTSPRIIKTHLPVQFVPKTFWEHNCKIVYVARNPKDNLVSSFHFDQMTILQPEPGNWSSYFQRFLQGKIAFGSWYDHVSNWWDKRETYNNLHYVFYEDMIQDTRREIDKVCSFLHLPRSSEEKDRVAAKAQFDKMKENAKVNHSGFPGFDETKSTFMRKGKVGNWKKYFTVAQNEKFDEDYKRKMKNSTLRFCTELSS